MKTGNKWGVLGVFSLAAALSQFLWLNFAPLITLVEKKYSVSEDLAGLLLLIFPLAYVVLSLPSGVLIDKKGYRFSLNLGTFLMAIFACLRIYDQSFTVLLIAQAGIAIAQPFVINAISKLVLDWFEKEQGAIATGLGTMGMFIGMSLGLGVTPPLVEHLGFVPTMIVCAVISIFCFIFSVLFVRTKHAEVAPQLTATVPLKMIKELFLEKQLVLLFILSFFGLGFFNGFTTWIELILAPYGINSVQAGTVGATLILGGILGAVAVPALSDLYRRRKPFLIGSIFVALATILPLCSTGNFNWLLVLAAVQGFFFLPAFSLLLEMCSEWVGEEKAGSATSILMLTGNAGGVVVIMAMEAIKGTDFRPSVYLLFVLLLLAAIISFFLKESHPRRGVFHEVT